MAFQLLHGDSREILTTIPDSSIDSIITDPPYGISFMGKRWDYDVPSVELWAECLRVLKPGGHMLAFAGARTQHRMAARIEDSGFEIRDMIAWVYGSGFPKSRDVSEAMERHQAGERPQHPGPAQFEPGVYQVTAFLREARDKAGWTNKQIDALFGTNGMAGHWTTAGSQPAVPSVRQWAVMKAAMGFGDEMDDLVQQLAATEKPEDGSSGEGRKRERFLDGLHKNKEANPAGPWGTGLKPAFEPITMARKPVAGTVAANVLTHGTGAMHLGACRIGEAARWPANLIHDASDEVLAVLPGDAARFFYCAKASRKDRGEGNNHPTVKPTDVMRYLVRLVTPPRGVVLDPFAGSGTTGKAAVLEGFRFIGVEREADYVSIAQRRIQEAANDNIASQEAAA